MAALVPNDRRESCRSGRLADLFRILECVRDWLLDQNSNPMLEASHRDTCMRGVGSGNDDPAGSDRVQHPVEVEKPRHVCRFRDATPFVRWIREADQIDIGLLQRSVDMRLSDQSCANHGKG